MKWTVGMLRARYIELYGEDMADDIDAIIAKAKQEVGSASEEDLVALAEQLLLEHF